MRGGGAAVALVLTLLLMVGANALWSSDGGSTSTTTLVAEADDGRDYPTPKQQAAPAPAAAAIRLVTTRRSDPITIYGGGPAHIRPPLRILGSDGLCVDVRNGWYNNGNPVQMWPCKWNNDTNQLWTFGSDGTLRSNGKCLASYGYTSGDYIMIYDCNPKADAFIWHSWPNGTISSPSGLVLTTASSAQRTTLSARYNADNTGQAWLPTNTTNPGVNQIAGLSGLCLHADGDVVRLRECANMEEGSWWALFPDSSIRPDKTRRVCLAAASGTHAGAGRQPLKTVICDPNSYLQRWLFARDGTIVNPRTQLVVDVLGASAVRGARLTLNPPAGTTTQKWLALL